MGTECDRKSHGTVGAGRRAVAKVSAPHENKGSAHVVWVGAKSTARQIATELWHLSLSGPLLDRWHPAT
jgi:hypothetical protein